MLNDINNTKRVLVQQGQCIFKWVNKPYQASNSTKCLDVKSDRWHIQNLQRYVEMHLQISDAKLIVTKLSNQVITPYPHFIAPGEHKLDQGLDETNRSPS